MTEIAVLSCVIGHKEGSIITGGSFTIISAPSSKVKIDGNGVYAKELEFSFSGGNAPGCSQGTVVTTSNPKILTTSTKTKIDGQGVLRKGDNVLMNAQGADPSTGAPVPVSGYVEILDPSQMKVIAYD